MEVTITHAFTKTIAHSQHFNQLSLVYPFRAIFAASRPDLYCKCYNSIAVPVGKTLHWSHEFIYSQSLSIHFSL